MTGSGLPPLSAVVERLVAAGCVAADEEAEELLAGAGDGPTVEAWLRRREQGEPLAWITGTLTFCGHRLHIDPGVYVPRIQSEELARRAVALLAPGGRAADLCTGAGAVAVHLQAEVPDAAVIGLDIDHRSIRCARINGVTSVVADLGAPLSSSSFDVVTAVAPYVPTDEMRLLPADVQRFEPRTALDGGIDGLDVVRRIVSEAGRLLRPGGWLVLEVGGDQDRILGPVLSASDFGPPASWYDDDGDLRGLTTVKGGSAPSS